MSKGKFYVVYDDCIIHEIGKTVHHVPYTAELADTFEEAKTNLIDYWETLKRDSEQNIKKAKMLKQTRKPK